MPSIAVFGEIHGKPLFEEAILPQGPAILTKNREIVRLTPTSQTKNKIIILINQIFHRVLCWLYPFKKTNYLGIVSAFDRANDKNALQIQNLDQQELLSYFKRFFKSDTASSQVIECIGQLESQLSSLEKLNLVEAYNAEHPHKTQKKVPDFASSWLTKVRHLEVGKQVLLLASNSSQDELFYLFSKDAEGTHLKIIGRGASMIELSGIQEVAVAGKVKIATTLSFRDLTPEQISDLIHLSALARPPSAHTPDPVGNEPLQPEQEKSTIERMKEILEECHLQESETTSPFNLGSQSTNSRKILQTLFKQINANAGMDHTEIARVKLRSKIYTLFSLLKEYRHTISSNTKHHKTLERMLHLCSQSLYIAHQKGTLSLEELGSLVEELRSVQKVLDATESSSKSSLSNLKISNVKIPIGKLTHPIEPQSIADTSMEDLLPSEVRLPMATPNFNAAPLFRREEILSSLPPRALLDLAEDAPLEKIVDTVFAINFFPFANDRHSSSIQSGLAQAEDAALWHDLSRAQALELVEKIHTLSENLAPHCRYPLVISADPLLALKKMIHMVTFLEHFKIQERPVEPNYYIWLMNLRGSNILKPTSIPFRYTLNPSNYLTYAQMEAWDSDFFQTCHADHGGGLNDKQAYEEAQRLYPHLNRELDLSGISGLYEDRNLENLALSSSLNHWIAPLIPSSLSATYHYLHLGEASYVGWQKRYHTKSRDSEGWGSVHETTDFDNRNTQEAITHDPQNSLEEFSSFFTQNSLSSLKTATESVFFSSWENTSDRTLTTEEMEKRNALTRTLIEQYLAQGQQMEPPFSDEDLTALLCLLGNKRPQYEILAFIKTHKSMLLSPQVRAFIQELFFNRSIETLLNRSTRENLQYFPEFFSSEMEESLAKLVENPHEAELTYFHFLLQMNDSLKELFEKSRRPTNLFYTVDPLRLQDLQTQFPLHPSSFGIKALEIKGLLKKENLSQEEISYLLIEMQKMKNNLHQNPAISATDARSIENGYNRLLNELDALENPFLSQEQMGYILDAICEQNGLTLDLSDWRGEHFLFENEQYEIDLRLGTIRNKSSTSIYTALPAAITTSSLFQTHFKDLLDTPRIRSHLYEEEDGRKVYLFQDKENRSCQIEEKEGVYSYYRSIDGLESSQKLQAAELFPTSALDSLSETSQTDPKVPSPFSILKALIKGEEQMDNSPAILKQPFFLDPQNPGIGYIVSSDGKLELKLEVQQENKKWSIKNIYDLRSEQESQPMFLASAEQIHSPLFDKLESFESKEHILLWAKKETSIKGRLFNQPVETIEFPRYGLRFSVKEDQLVCQTPPYADYKISLDATINKRKGFSHSLLLTHPDRTRPEILLLPKASLLVPDTTPLKSFSGLAYVIHMIQTLVRLIFKKAPPQLTTQIEMQIDPAGSKQELIALELHPQTREIIYQEGKSLLQSRELVKHAIAAGEYELALEILEKVPLENRDPVIRSWIAFTKKLGTNPQTAAVGLKFANRLLASIEKDKEHKPIRKELNNVRADLFKKAMAQGKKTPASLRFNEEELTHLRRLVEKRDPTYYRMHILPFLQRADQINLPINYGNGRIENLLEIPVIERAPKPSVKSQIETLEEMISPDVSIPDEELAQTLALREEPLTLLYTPEELETYFNADYTLKETVTPSLFRKKIQKEQERLESLKKEEEENLHRILYTSSDPVEQLAIYAKEKRIATPTDLMIALVQNDLEGLQDKNLLPAETDLEELERILISYYDLEVKIHLARRSLSLLTLLSTENRTSDLWSSKSQELFELLTLKRRYDERLHPELTIFEAFHFMTLRDGSESSQLDLLASILENPSGITQAGTGSGKSSVLSILRALEKANGTNLVTYKVLPQLYPETEALLKERFEKTFKRKIFPFRFDLSMPRQDAKGKSVLIGIYQRMLETIQDKGCILTDYKSFPVMEEKFWSLSQELLGMQEAGIELNPLKLTEWTYLRKILILLQNKEDQLMDEFDEPNRPVHRIQVQIAQGEKLPEFMLETSLDLYNRLLQEENLHLKANLQGEIPEAVRKACIARVADAVAAEKAAEYRLPHATRERIRNYILGENEDLLAHIEPLTPEQKDILAFLKEEFSTFLPLTLSYSGISKYQKSPDGKRIITCHLGDPKQAKFGNPIEEINYSIQEYLQHGVALATVHAWVSDAITQFRTREPGAEERFARLIPRAITLARLQALTPQELDQVILDQILPAINENPESVEFFLRRHLDELRSGGSVVSMTPQDTFPMSRIISGISATIGSQGALHSQLQINPEIADQIRNQMKDRFRRRVFENPVLYDPAHPLEILNRNLPQAISVIIDGAGAYRECKPQDVAQRLLNANPRLRKVEYYDTNGTIRFVGDPQAPLEAKGFYFPQAYSRGADQVFGGNSIALLTANEPGTMEDLSQQEGRMRQESQRILLAVSNLAPERMRTRDGVIQSKEENEENQNRQERLRAEGQRLHHVMRTAARTILLSHETLDGPFPEQFANFKHLLIQPKHAGYPQPGDYFQAHQRITPSNLDPIAELELLKENLVRETQDLGLPTDQLEAIAYPPELREHLPESTPPLTALQGLQLEVEVEQQLETQCETEQEIDEEMESQITKAGNKKVASYLPRGPRSRALHPISRLHPALDHPKLNFLDTFLPLDRADSLHHRTPFDDRMNRIGVVKVYFGRERVEFVRGRLLRARPEIERVVIGDVAEDFNLHNLLGEREYRDNTFLYDTRTGRVFAGEDGARISQTDEFKEIIARIKFLDGRIDGYKEEDFIHLTRWFEAEHNAQEMRQLFEKTIIRHRKQTLGRYQYSQIWDYFERLGTRTTLRTF